MYAFQQDMVIFSSKRGLKPLENWDDPANAAAIALNVFIIH
jgi:hypothetical protein